MSLRVLFATSSLADLAGTEVYTRDMALELRRLGHTPVVYASRLGRVSDELARAGILVTGTPRKLHFQPDIIHGHHYHETWAAIRRYRDTPAIFICHDHFHWSAAPLIHSRVLRYLGVSELCLARLSKSGVPEDKIRQAFNFVDTRRFGPRQPLPPKPRRALLFSNYARTDTYAPAIAEACRRAGLELTIVGSGVSNPVERPEEILGRYDIVFGKAKCAMEAMAVGTAVILCDCGGVGPMVTSRNFDELRPLNFGYQALTEPHTPEVIMRRIEQYDPLDAAAVRDLLRAAAGLDTAAQTLVRSYQEVIAEYRERRPISAGIRDLACLARIPRCIVARRLTCLWQSVSPDRRRLLSDSRVLRPLMGLARRVMRG